MIEHYQRLFKLMNRQMKKYWTLHNVKAYIENRTKIAQSKFLNGENKVGEYNTFAKEFNDRTSIQVVQGTNEKVLDPSSSLIRKVVKWQRWYYQVTGLDAVEAAKHRVDDCHNRLFKYQNDKRSLSTELADIEHELQKVYGELVRTERDDLKYVHWTTLENKLLQEQKKVRSQFELVDMKERDAFIELTTAIKEYHDIQNLNAQKYKYLSIIASVLVALFSFIGSMIINNRRILDVRNAINEAQERNISLLAKNTNRLSDLQNMLHSFGNRFSQDTHIDERKEVDKESENTSNLLTSCAKYSAYAILSGAGYMKSGVYVCGSYVKKLFYS